MPEGAGEQFISSPAVFDLIAPDAPSVPVKVDLVYDRSDPLVVHASFRTGSQTAVDWELSRHLLSEGLIRPAGIGDVHVRPFASDPTKVQLELSSPSGWALFTTCARALDDFLRRTYAAVPPGTEAARLDVDLALADLLDP